MFRQRFVFLSLFFLISCGLLYAELNSATQDEMLGLPTLPVPADNPITKEKKRRGLLGQHLFPNTYLHGLVNINKDIVAFKQVHSPFQRATLDMDATLIETSKNEALEAMDCYKGFKAYQPLNTYWFEQDLVLHSEFRDGNVPAGGGPASGV
ncbi:hypothetical protein ACFL27_19850 [candidate division CSSED10-310 bacterium]|uniref:Uncharacterized protein n=1 Tax=candidate division CSSED10-310 bacterium TaxID=2855610 RepID=A0ABV6Z1X5_UNCC1